MRLDVAIIGGGIVGLATAHEILQRRPGTRLAILEKEPGLARHQSGHNSGVLHSGIYYLPGSLKAQTCRMGRLQMEAFCRRAGVPFEMCGKVIVATDQAELPGLQSLFGRGKQNGVSCRWVDAHEIPQLEPHVRGVAAIHVADAGIVDYRAVCEALADRIARHDGQLLVGHRVSRVEQGAQHVRVMTDRDTLEAGIVVNCAGLYSDRVARSAGARPAAHILPFRGEYYQLQPAARTLCRNLVYPVPDPRFPFLGVHFTRGITGEVECGPNAVLAWAREGYRHGDINLADLAEIVTYRGTWRMAARHWRVGCAEWWRSISKQAFLRSLQRLIPALRGKDLVPGPAGVRAQAVLPNGQFVDDFVVERSGGVVHVYNAPSPAATASLQIGRMIADQANP